MRYTVEARPRNIHCNNSATQKVAVIVAANVAPQRWLPISGVILLKK
jgi:hypothetical protein